MTGEPSEIRPGDIVSGLEPAELVEVVRVAAFGARTLVEGVGVESQRRVRRPLHLHGLRHFHAFQLAQKGVKLHVVQQQLGHSRLDTTSTYISHLSAKDIGDEIRRAFSA